MTSKCNVEHSAFVGKYCPSCGSKIEVDSELCANGHVMKVGAKFCAECGSKTSSLENVCSNKHPIQEGAIFCNVCGEKVFNKKKEVIEFKTISNNMPNRHKDLIYPRLNQTPIIRTTESFHQANNLSPNVGLQNFDSFSKRNTNRNFVLMGLVSLAILILGIAFVGTVNSRSAPVTVTVEMTLLDEFDCFNVSWGYSDIPGGQVVLDVDGIEYFGTYNSFGTATGSGCKFTASISGVESNGVNYSIGMASGRRGTIYNTRENLQANDWTFYLSLG